MTTYPITLPTTPKISAARFGLLSNMTLFSSPLTRVQQVLSRPGQVWQADCSLPMMLEATAAPWRAALTSLRGRQGTFTLGDPAYTGARGTVAGTPLVNGASQTGNNLITDGWGASATILKGDYFALGNYLYIMTIDVTATGGGAATLTFEPTLRASPANNAAVTVSSPKALMRLTADDARWEETPGLWGMSFNCVEAL